MTTKSNDYRDHLQHEHSNIKTHY